jgi:hypothetical protein
MADNTTPDRTEELPKGWNWRAIGAVLTLVYVVVATFMGFFDTKLFNPEKPLGLNEIGDALAGFFAPLAFLWLFVATMIQGQELADNRRVMEEQARAAKDQVIAAEKQVAFMGDQIAAMKAQNNLANQVAKTNHQLALFDKRVTIYDLLWAAGGKVFVEGKVSEEVKSQLFKASQMSRWFFDDAVANWISDIHSKATEAVRGERMMDREFKLRDEKPEKWNDEKEEALDKLHNKITALTDVIEGLLEPVEIDSMLGPYLKLTLDVEPIKEGI